MTRLKVKDIKSIAWRLQQYDDELVRKTGHTLLGIACHSAGVLKNEILPDIAVTTAAAVPIAAGKGVIGGFSTAVKAILVHLGFAAFVTGQSDVAGMAEAFEKKAHLVFAADDNRFLVFDLRCGMVVDNAAATGWGFAAGLDLLSGGLAGQEVSVLGLGRVGMSAVKRLLRFGARVGVYDIAADFTSRKLDLLREQVGVDLYSTCIVVEKALEPALSRYRFIIDATNAGGIIPEEVIKPDTFIAAPGMPLGLTPGAVGKIGDRLLHDPLQIGAAAMAMMAVNAFKSLKETTDSKNKIWGSK